MSTGSKFPIRLSAQRNPSSPKDVVLRILIGHPMESGFRMAENGIDQIPKNIIEKVWVTCNDTLIFQAELGTGIAANPLLSFMFEPPAQGGVVTVHWLDDHGQQGQASKQLEAAHD